MKFTLGDIAKATSGKIIAGNSELPVDGISIDTRKLSKANLFVAIKGTHFDGHDYITNAVDAGASAIMVGARRAVPLQDIACIKVENTERALGDIATWWRKQINIPCVAITGSNGKSTTKEMIAAIAGNLGSVLKTEGNFNNLIGLPLTIFRMEKSHNVAILEMGMNAPGEIRRLAEIANPDVGLITNATAAHLEKLHTVEAVASAKGELFTTMRPDAVAVVNGEDLLVRELGQRRLGKKIVFGMQNNFDVRFLHMDTDGLESMDLKIAVLGKEYNFKLPVTGVHNVMNAMAAISVGIALGVGPSEAIEKLVNFHPMAMRMERVQLANGVCVINDSYNANPESVKAALRTVGAAKRAGKFIAALGDMLELGGASDELHKEIGRACVKMGVERLYVAGNFAEKIAEGAESQGLSFSAITICSGGVDEMQKKIESELYAGDVLLVKGSRGMKMERVVEYLKNSIGTG